MNPTTIQLNPTQPSSVSPRPTYNPFSNHCSGLEHDGAAHLPLPPPSTHTNTQTHTYLQGPAAGAHKGHLASWHPYSFFPLPEASHSPENQSRFKSRHGLFPANARPCGLGRERKREPDLSTRLSLITHTHTQKKMSVVMC